jgi:hypothetical protein
MQPEVVKNRADRLLPLVVEGEAVQGSCASLARPFEGDDVEPGAAEALPDRWNSSIKESNPPCSSTVP